jgi:hypothetical protein
MNSVDVHPRSNVNVVLLELLVGVFVFEIGRKFFRLKKEPFLPELHTDIGG